MENPDDAADDELEDDPALSVARPIPGRRKRKLLEAIFSNPDAGTADDDANYRQLLEGGGILDVPPGIQEKLQRLSLLLYRKNVMAFAAIEVKNDFTVGPGIKIVAVDPKVQEVLDEHWAENEWDELLEERTRLLALMGELLLEKWVRPADGLVRVASIPGIQIADVLRDEEITRRLTRVLVYAGKKRAAAMIPGGVIEAETKPYAIIQPDWTTGLLSGDAFFFAVNRPDGANRGTPDLCASLDWMEGLDGLIFSLMERAEISQDVVFDLEYEGAQEPELKKHVRKFVTALKSGGVFAHNEKVKLNLKSPNLAAQDAKDIVGILKGQSYTGSRLASLFLGSGEDLTRASAQEVSIPVAKGFESRQKFIQRLLKKVLSYQIQESKRAGVLAGVTDFRFEVRMPRIFLRDLSTVSSAIQLVSIGLQLAIQNRWITDDEAKNTFRVVLGDLGVDVGEQKIIQRPETEPKAPVVTPPVPAAPPAPVAPSPTEPPAAPGTKEGA